MNLNDKTKEELINDLEELRLENIYLKELYDEERTFRNYSNDAMRETNIIILALEGGNMAWWEMDVPTGNVTFSNRKVEMLGNPPEYYNNSFIITYELNN